MRPAIYPTRGAGFNPANASFVPTVRQLELELPAAKAPNPLRWPCLTCGAGVGELCVTGSGGLTAVEHRSRIVAGSRVIATDNRR